MDTFLRICFGRGSRQRHLVILVIFIGLFLFSRFAWPFAMGAAFFAGLLVVDFLLCCYYIFQIPIDVSESWQAEKQTVKAFFSFYEVNTAWYLKRVLQAYEKNAEHQACKAEEERLQEEQEHQARLQRQRERRLNHIIDLAQQVKDRKNAMDLLPLLHQWECPLPVLRSYLENRNEEYWTTFEDACQRALGSYNWYARALAAGSVIKELEQIQKEFICLVRNDNVPRAKFLVLAAEDRAKLFQQALSLGITHCDNITFDELKALVERAQTINDRQ